MIDIDSITLKVGSHEGPDDGFCLMEAVAYIAGEPWSDRPMCASPVIAAFLRSYNDSVSDEIRQSLKQYIPRLVGTRGSDALEERRSLIAANWLVRVHTSAWLRLAGLTEQADALASLPRITSMAQIHSIKGLIEAARDSASAAVDGAESATWAAAGSVARALARDAARDAVWSWTAARDAARIAIVAGIALQPTVDELQATIPTLIERMLTATEDEV